MEDLTGKQLGRYQVVSPLGEGGMAAVYKAFQPGMDRYVALKILPQQYARDAEFTGRFEQEAKVIAKLQHPHVLPVHDYGEADDYTYIVMPLVETGTLADLLRGQKPMSLQRIRIIITQLGDALDYAHSQGLIHRDIKPSNVLIDKRGNCLLTDFGIAKMVEGTKHFTQTGGIVGTPHYMSPEQGGGDPLTPQSDIYSLGVVLYEMVTGRVPFDAETPMAVVIKHMTDPLPPPSTLNPDVSPALESVILKAMAKRPKDRFESAAAMVRAVRLAVPESEIAREPSQVGTVPTEDLAQAEAAASDIAIEPPSQTITARRVAPWLVGAAAVGVVGICAISVFVIARLATTASTSAATESALPTAAAQLATAPLATSPVSATATPELSSSPTASDDSQAAARIRTAFRESSPADLPSARWPVAISDSFDSDINDWSPISEVEDEFGSRSFTFENGKYHWEVLPTDGLSVHHTPEMNPISEFAVSVDAQQLSGSQEADFGIVFRETAVDAFYNFNIDNQQNYWLRRNDSGNWSTLIDLTRTAAIQPNTPNRVTVVANDGYFYFFINDQYVDEIEEQSMLRGRVGMVVNLFEPGVATEWEFDNFELRQPWTAAIIDTFDAVSGLWDVGSFSFEDLTDTLAITEGKYVWSLDCGNTEYGCLSSTYLDDLAATTDFELKVDARRLEGPVDGEYGVRFRDDGENYLEFLISDAGRFTISLWYEQNLDYYYVDNPTLLIDPEGVNQLTVIGEGPNFAFYINGLLVGEIVEELLPFGSFALVASVDGADQAMLEFDNFRVRTP
ncbi:MAG: serine/threonine protein kinase [Anaerolineales bacterium]